MALATDLMGLGLPAQLAGVMADGGTGPVTLVALTGGAAGAAKILANQSCVFVPSGTGGVILPASSTGLSVFDDYVVHNGTGGTITVYPPSGTTINVSGSAITQASPLAVTTLKTAVFWAGPTATQWFGIMA